MTDRNGTSRISRDESKAVTTGLVPIMIPAAPAPMYFKPNNVNRWLPSTPRLKRAKTVQSHGANLTEGPSVHHQRGISASNAPVAGTTEISTAEKAPSVNFWPPMEPPL